MKNRIEALETELAIVADQLLAYKEYYGTSFEQVKHLQTCMSCYSFFRCRDYPRE